MHSGLNTVTVGADNTKVFPATSLLSRQDNKSDVFVLCVLYIRSNLFETRQMGKVVQHCKNILNPSPDLLRGVVSHQT